MAKFVVILRFALLGLLIAGCTPATTSLISNTLSLIPTFVSENTQTDEEMLIHSLKCPQRDPYTQENTSHSGQSYEYRCSNPTDSYTDLIIKGFASQAEAEAAFNQGIGIHPRTSLKGFVGANWQQSASFYPAGYQSFTYYLGQSHIVIIEEFWESGILGGGPDIGFNLELFSRTLKFMAAPP